jgi:hypothetical protein
MNADRALSAARWIGYLPEVSTSRLALDVYRAEDRVQAARQALADAEASLKTAIADMETRIAYDWTPEEIAEAKADAGLSDAVATASESPDPAQS